MKDGSCCRMRWPSALRTPAWPLHQVRAQAPANIETDADEQCQYAFIVCCDFGLAVAHQLRQVRAQSPARGRSRCQGEVRSTTPLVADVALQFVRRHGHCTKASPACRHSSLQEKGGIHIQPCAGLVTRLSLLLARRGGCTLVPPEAGTAALCRTSVRLLNNNMVESDAGGKWEHTICQVQAHPPVPQHVFEPARIINRSCTSEWTAVATHCVHAAHFLPKQCWCDTARSLRLMRRLQASPVCHIRW